MKDLLLALDAGTSGGRATLYDPAGRTVGAASEAWSYTTPPEAAPWGRAFDTGEFWGILCGLVRRALAEAGARGEQVLAVGASSQRQGIVLLDASGTTLYAGPNLDLRGVYQAAEIDAEHGDLLYRVSGHRPGLIFAPARLRWLRERQPSLYERIATLLMISDWLVFCLSSAFCSEPTAAAESQLLDITTGRWSSRLVEALGLSGDILPPLRAAGEIAGFVTRAAADATGLRAGTPVAVGGADTQCGLLGMGVFAPGQVGALAGWSMPLQQVLDRPPDLDGRLWGSRHLLADRWVLESNAGPAGRSYAWLRETVFGGCSYAELDRLAALAPPGAEGSLAFLGAQAMDAGAMGLTWGGLLFPLALDFIDGRREHLARAALESIAFAARANLEQLTAASRQSPPAIALGGGLTRSRLFRQLMADVLGLPVAAAEMPDTSSGGAAMCAATAAGLYTDLPEAACAMSARSTIHEPQRTTHGEYLDAYERWLVAQRHLAELSRCLQ